MTAQTHEQLILEGELTSMSTCPPIPVGHPGVVFVEDPAEAARAHPMAGTTACWRGYVGTWEVRGSRFYLVKLAGRFCFNPPEPLPADWFSGELVIPRGKMLQYVHMGFESVYEEELHLKIEQGLVTNTWLIDNRGKQFSA